MNESRCHSEHPSVIGLTVQCEREYGHGGAHTARVDDAEIDPDFTYVVSWWPKDDRVLSANKEKVASEA